MQGESKSIESRRKKERENAVRKQKECAAELNSTE
jgi:hypothetical protein